MPESTLAAVLADLGCIHVADFTISRPLVEVPSECRWGMWVPGRDVEVDIQLREPEEE